MKTKNITLGGIFAALSVIFVYLSNLVPSSKLALLTITTCIIMYSITLINVKYTLLVYASTSLISVLSLGIRGIPLTYICFFGLYGFIKLFTERLNNKTLEFTLKLLFFNASLAICYFILKTLFFPPIIDKIPIYLIILICQVVFVVFDYALTLVISYLNKLNLFKRG